MIIIIKMKHYINSLTDLPIPENATEIIIFNDNIFKDNENPIDIPDCVTKLTIGHVDSQIKSYEFLNSKLPNSIKYLKIVNLVKPLINLPINFEILEINYYKKEALEKSKIPFGCQLKLGTEL